MEWRAALRTRRRVQAARDAMLVGRRSRKRARLVASSGQDVRQSAVSRPAAQVCVDTVAEEDARRREFYGRAASWCEGVGLTARVARGSRVCSRRSSPGVGVSRRSQVRGFVSATKCGFAQRGVRGRSSARETLDSLVLRQSLRSREVELLDFGSRLGKCSGKCLQNAVLGLCRSRLWEELRCNLQARCSNQSGSGMSSLQEWRNLVSVRSALLERRLSVVVVSSTSRTTA